MVNARERADNERVLMNNKITIRGLRETHGRREP